MSLNGSSEELNPFHEDADPNEIYELIQLLGEGSYGSVYKGGTKYQIKQLNSNQTIILPAFLHLLVHRTAKTTAAVKIVSYGNKSSVTGGKKRSFFKKCSSL